MLKTAQKSRDVWQPLFRGSERVLPAQESHCQPVEALVFNTLDTQCSNLFATVGRDQATVYDDQHMGDFIGVVVHFVNQPTPHTKGGVRPAA